MEARLGGEAHQIYDVGAGEMWGVGKRSVEWDLNDWKWDGDLFIASSLNPGTSGNGSRQFFPPRAGLNSSNSSSSCSDEVNVGIEKGRDDLEKKRRVIVIDDEPLNDEETGSLCLKLGGQGYPVNGRDAANWEGSSGKKTKVIGGASISRAACQVQDCGADLSNAKDYHRRHKVCEMHSKATKALVGNVMQRFCQQCSRFHILEEFDEGKRSCRRRLAGHNKRRRKTNPEPACNGNTMNNDHTSSYLLISLLKILSNMHTNKSDQAGNQDLLTHLLSSLASQAVGNGERNLSALLQGPPNSLNDGTLYKNSEKAVCASNANGLNTQITSSVKPTTADSYPVLPEARDGGVGHARINNFDLNDVYVDSDDGTEDAERSPVIANVGSSPDWLQQDSHKSSPPQTSGNSDSASARSPSSSNGDGQSHTDRIVFKLFGKEPNDFPLVLRAQILDWLSHSPTDIESYIRPGCIILTVYLRQSEASWEELCCNLGSSLSRLLDASNDTFWRTGWLYIWVQDQIALIYNGKVVVDTYLPPSSNSYSKILSIKPIAISQSERAKFVIKGVNLSRPATRLLCAIEGKYMVQEDTHESIEEVEGFKERDDVHSVNFSCSIPAVSGRGFIEMEDDGFTGSFFPFIVAEEDVCSEIRMLEVALDFDKNDVDEVGNTEAKNQAMDFINEMGWLLHRSQVKSRLGHLDPNADLFTFRRFKWLMEFSMDHEWCAVVRKLLNFLLGGLVGTGEHLSLHLALSEMGLLHRAVRKNSRSLVVFLLRYVPERFGPENKELAGGSHSTFLFRPNIPGPGGLTPLHIAAGKDGSEDVLDALTDDPGMVGIEAWKNARDSTGFTPEDYARLRGHYSYIHLVQKKFNKRPSTGHVVVDIATAVTDVKVVDKKENEGLVSNFEIGRPVRSSCKLCTKKLAYGTATRSMYYRPAMLSLVGIAAVCVCVALLFKSCPEVVYMFRPFRWETLEYGSS